MSNSSEAIGREPCQNPVFMFLPSSSSSGGVKPGQMGCGSHSRTVFSVPGATAEGQRATVLKRNMVTPMSHSCAYAGTLTIPPTTTPSKKRSRAGPPPPPPPVLPFRLPSAAEELEQSTGAGTSSPSAGGSGDKVTTSSPSAIIKDPIPAPSTGLTLSQEEAELLRPFRHVALHESDDEDEGNPYAGFFYQLCLAGPRLFSLITKEMAEKVGEIGTEKVDSSNLEELKQWLNDSIHGWFTALHMRDNDGRRVSNPPPEFGKELTTMLLEVYGMAIIKDLFSAIIEFPESKPLLDDLKTCMKSVNMRNSLVSNLKSSLERRLLNAGVNTSEVLEAYISTVRALKYVDPTGILVQLVTPPVREYLKYREETVRVILISLTEESGELSEELARNPTNPDKTCKLTLKNYKLWKPDPIDVPKDKHNLRKSDLIETMVSIYGSKTVFIDEYRALLADRLLRMPKPGSITREIKCLELLKLRFGEADLQKCEVMLKDVSDSQRLNTRFYEEEGAVLANEAVPVSGLVVSAQFWPSFKHEDIILPGPAQAALEKYTKAFEMIKGNRTLEWQKHIGTVKIEIDHGESTMSFSVSPIQATIIWHFQEQDKWTLDELAKVTGTTSSYLSNRIGFWVSKGLIIHTGQGKYVLADPIRNEPSKATGVIPNKYVEEVETDSPMASTSSQRATELQVFWSYIEAMLTNLESLPLVRIHSMLKLFATVECSSEDLQKFLDDKVSHNLLVYSAGQYQLPK